MIIPRVIHFIWLGSSLPDWAVTNVESWQRYHLGYQIKVWSDYNLPGMENRGLFDRVPSYAQKADILRYELLFRFGGLYVDTDTVCYKGLEPIISDYASFCGSHDEAEIAIGCLGSVPGHPMYRTMLDRLPLSVAKLPRSDVVAASGPGFFTRNFHRWVNGAFTHRECWYNPALCPMRVFPPEYFYPVHWTGRVFGKREDAYAEHQWKFSWKPYFEGKL